MTTASTGRVAAAASLVLLLVLSPARAAGPPEVLWETSSQMAMAGMRARDDLRRLGFVQGRDQGHRQGTDMTVKLSGEKVGTRRQPTVADRPVPGPSSSVEQRP